MLPKGRIGFFGGIDVEQTFRHGTPEGASVEVGEFLGKLAGPEGGSTASPTSAFLQDIPVENLVAALRVLLRHAGISAEDGASHERDKGSGQARR